MKNLKLAFLIIILIPGMASSATLTASASPSTSGGIIVSYIWTEDDKILGQEATLKKVFEKGNHAIKVVVTDNTGAKAEDTVKITVAPQGAGNATSLDSDSDGLSDELEVRMGTDPNNPDTDDDGIIDSKDPNPLVANGKGLVPDLGGNLGTLLQYVKWAAIVGGIIIAIIYIREKLLDLLWERKQEWGE